MESFNLVGPTPETFPSQIAHKVEETMLWASNMIKMTKTTSLMKHYFSKTVQSFFFLP